MINPFLIKKWAALVSVGMITTMGFFIGLRFYGFVMALAIMAVCLAFSVFLGDRLLDNPFRAMTEGKGIMGLNLDSTGILRPFLIQVHGFYMYGHIAGRKIKDAFDRAVVYQLAAPRSAQGFFLDERFVDDVLGYLDYKEQLELFKCGPDQKKADKVKAEYTQLKTQARLNLKKYVGALNITLNEKEYNDARFGLFHYPLILYNEQIGSVLTKDWLSGEEKTGFSEHQVLYLNRKMEELTSIVRDFSRYVIELLKPKEQGGNNWLIYVAIGVVIILLLLFIGPQIWQTLTNSGGAVLNAASGAVNTGKDTFVPITG